MKNSIWIGFDPREGQEFGTCRHSVERYALKHWPIAGLVLSRLQRAGLYTRPTSMSVNSDGHTVMIDELSKRPDYDGRISTQHAIARFLVPHLAQEGWALFMDGDMLIRSPLPPLFASLDYSKAVHCVHHQYAPPEGVKMDGQAQTQYARKNWSSFVIFNCDHPANEKLTLEMVNTLPGRDLHAFCWLEDRHIGELDQSWNYLIGHTDEEIEPDNIHWTSGTPARKGYESVPYADEWREVRDDWAQGCLSLPG